MNIVRFKLNSGPSLRLIESHAAALARRGRGTYLTRDMRAEVPASIVQDAAVDVAVEPPAEPVPAGDDFSSLTAAELHALARDRGIVVHHRAGADKVRAALRESENQA